MIQGTALRRMILVVASFLLPGLQGCSILSELSALTKCEFSFHSVQDPLVCNIDVRNKHSLTDFSLADGQMLLGNLLRETLPFAITANIEVKNPGPATAAVQAVDWIAFIDDIQVAQGRVNDRVEVAPGGGVSLIPVRISTDLFEFLEGDHPRTMLNFALNLMDAGDQPTRLSMQIKPSVLVGGRAIKYPGYFTITREFSPGN